MVRPIRTCSEFLSVKIVNLEQLHSSWTIRASGTTAHGSSHLRALVSELSGISSSVGENCARNRLQRKDPVNSAKLDGFFGHPKDYACGFVLRNGRGASLLHLRHSTSAIVAHSRKDHTDRIWSGITARRNETTRPPMADAGTPVALP